jgi:hypothetical protein
MCTVHIFIGACMHVVRYRHACYMHTYVYLLVWVHATCLHTHGYLGQQLYWAAWNGKTSEIVALLSNPEARSFINWQNPNQVACPTSPAPLLACFCEYISVYQLIESRS